MAALPSIRKRKVLPDSYEVLRKQPLKVVSWAAVNIGIYIFLAVHHFTKFFTNHSNLDELYTQLGLSFVQAVIFSFLYTISIAVWIILVEIERLEKHNSSIKSYDSWNHAEIKAEIAAASKSIVIVDSYFDETTSLEDCVKTALASGAQKLQVSIYMLDPSMPFGAQRFREKMRIRDKEKLTIANATEFKESLNSLMSQGERDEYARKFADYVKDIYSALGGLDVVLKVYKYPSMPSVRVTLIDNRTAFFGWFPLGDHNPVFICFSLHEHLLGRADREVFKALREQITNIESVSVPVPRPVGSR